MSVSPAHRFVCVHGHFYQPPRENPWLEAVETQDSAAPYHDWNERITAECYATNGAARIVDSKNRILRITNNYARMSFNLGPTLVASKVPERARAELVEAREGRAVRSDRDYFERLIVFQNRTSRLPRRPIPESHGSIGAGRHEG